MWGGGNGTDGRVCRGVTFNPTPPHAVTEQILRAATVEQYGFQNQTRVHYFE